MQNRNLLRCVAKYVLHGEFDLSRIGFSLAPIVPASDIYRVEVDSAQKRAAIRRHCDRVRRYA